MFCKNCGQELNDNAVICPHCGVATSKLTGQQSYELPKTNGMGIAGFAVGLVGMFGGNFIYLMPGILGLILSIVGIVRIKKCNKCNGLAIAGLIISIISFIFWLIVWIVAIQMMISGELPGYVPQQPTQ